MPIHDWSQVIAGAFHHFHQTWVIEISRALNAGVLPPGYYAMAEQVAGGLIPDVLALETPDDEDEPLSKAGGVATLSVDTKPPQVRLHAKLELDQYARKAASVAIRHSSNHRIVAMIEIVSPGNKSSEHALVQFVKKTKEFLDAGIHLLIIDLIAPGRFDPQGIHGAIWDQYKEPYTAPPGQPLTLASYVAGQDAEAYIEPTAVGKTVLDMPIFLFEGNYILAPLAGTYDSAFAAVPEFWRKVLAK